MQRREEPIDPLHEKIRDSSQRSIESHRVDFEAKPYLSGDVAKARETHIETQAPKAPDIRPAARKGRNGRDDPPGLGRGANCLAPRSRQQFGRAVEARAKRSFSKRPTIVVKS